MYRKYNEELCDTSDELYHYGVKGMKWGVRKAQKFSTKARTARESAKEWDEMAKYASQKGKTKRAEKYSRYAAEERAEARRYDNKAKSISSPAKRVDKGRNKAKKMLQTGVKASAKTVSIGSQMAARMIQNATVYNTTGAIFDHYMY